jgi:CrcB protein
VNGVALGLLVAAAAAVGAPCRYALEWAVHRHRPTVTPFGTLLVNASGSLAHGLDPDVGTVVGTGFLGAYTTFSTYADQTVRRAADGHTRIATAYAIGSVVTCVSAAALGLAATGAW